MNKRYDCCQFTGIHNVTCFWHCRVINEQKVWLLSVHRYTQCDMLLTLQSDKWTKGMTVVSSQVYTVWHASDSKAAACNEWDLCLILYLPTMRCSCCCSLSVRDIQPSGTTDTSPAFISPHFWHPTAQIWTDLTTRDGEKCSSRSTNIDELKQCLFNVWHGFEQCVVNDTGDKWHRHLCIGCLLYTSPSPRD